MDNERRQSARREVDRLVEHRLEALERICEALGPAVGQVARIDGTLQALTDWLRDEREARRHHDSELDDRLQAHRDFVDGKVGDLEDKIDARFDECSGQIRTLGGEQRTGRRTTLLALLAAVVTIVASLIAAYATVKTATTTSLP